MEKNGEDKLERQGEKGRLLRRNKKQEEEMDRMC